MNSKKEKMKEIQNQIEGEQQKKNVRFFHYFYIFLKKISTKIGNL